MGQALAYRKYSFDYVAAEEFGKNNEIGFWNTTMEPPWEWRKKQRRK